MADNPIQFNDLVSESAIEGLQRLIDTIDKLLQQMDGLKSATQQSAQAYTQQVQAIQTDTAAMAEMAVKVATLERGYEDLQKVYEKLKSDKKQLAEEQRKYKKLTAEEAESVRHLSATIDDYIRLTNSENKSLKWLADAYGKNIVEIDMQKKSYNELYATYNALKDALNKMTIEQRTNTEAGKRMTEQALKIRDTLNELQKSTGNYTLQVGKYRAAFDGLGYSFQQILREAPSALNINQFFLAISNNIPMFLDQVKAFNEEQKAIKANLAQMTEGTKEYAEQMGKVMTLGQKLAKTLLSWQSLVLVGLLLIRNLPRIIEWVKSLVDKTEKESAALGVVIEKIRVLTSAIKSVAQVSVELTYIQNKLTDVNYQNEKWVDYVQRVNELTNANIDPLTATRDMVVDIIDKYKKLQMQMAINQKVFEKFAEDEERRAIITGAGKMNSLGQLRQYLGYEGNIKNEALASEGLRYLRLYQEGRRDMERFGSPDSEHMKKETATWRLLGYTDEQIEEQRKKWLEEARKKAQPYTLELATRFINQGFGEEVLKPLMTEDMRASLESLIDIEADIFKNNGGGGRNKDFSPADYYWEQQEAIIKATTWGYEQERKLAEMNYFKQKDEAEKRLEADKKDIDENIKDKKEAESLKQKLTAQTNDIITGYAEELRANLLAIRDKELKDEQDRNEAMRQDRIAADKEDIQALKDKYDEMEKVNKKRRVRTMKDEINNNEKITASIIAMQEHLAELRAMQPREDIEGYNKEVQRLTDSIAKLQTQIDHTRELKGRDLKTILFEGIQGGVGNGTKQSILESILGKDAYKAFENDSEKLQEAVESDFETWLNTTADAVKEWYSTTLGYIQDLMQAYIDLANAKAEAAAEETAAAQEQYEKEKALMEAGYANRMETAWAEYQEKRDLQKKAEADAKQAERNQEMLNAAMQASEIATAVAKIYAQFANSPWGIALATALSATMVAAFVAAKSKAIEATRYGDGTAELIQGGSHASGHDVSLAYDSKGRERRVEGGEVFGVINRRAVRRYGADNVMSLINSLNRGTYEGHATRLMAMQNELSGGAGNAVVSSKTDLRRVESGIDKLVGYSQHRTYTEADGTVVEQHPNGTVRYLKH